MPPLFFSVEGTPTSIPLLLLLLLEQVLLLRLPALTFVDMFHLLGRLVLVAVVVLLPLVVLVVVLIVVAVWLVVVREDFLFFCLSVVEVETGGLGL